MNIKLTDVSGYLWELGTHIQEMEARLSRYRNVCLKVKEAWAIDRQSMQAVDAFVELERVLNLEGLTLPPMDDYVEVVNGTRDD